MKKMKTKVGAARKRLGKGFAPSGKTPRKPTTKRTKRPRSAY